MINFRTDMADERNEMYNAIHDLDGNIRGIETIQEQKNKNIKQNTVSVLNSEAEEAIGKPIGKYVTFDLKNLKYADENEINDTAQIIAEELKKMIDEKVKNEEAEVLVVGLGNQFVTPDSLGPKVISEVEITRHLKKYAPKYIVSGAKSISAIAPGVLGTTRN